MNLWLRTFVALPMNDPGGQTNQGKRFGDESIETNLHHELAAEQEVKLIKLVDMKIRASATWGNARDIHGDVGGPALAIGKKGIVESRSTFDGSEASEFRDVVLQVFQFLALPARSTGATGTRDLHAKRVRVACFKTVERPSRQSNEAFRSYSGEPLP